MVFRRHVIANSETLADSEVWDTDLKGLGAISAIEIEVTAQNGTTDNLNNHIDDLVKKIEVVDGAYKAHSLSGKQEQILDWMQFRRPPVVHMDETPSVTQIGKFIMPFGTFIGDPSLYLDADMYNNPKLNVQFDIAAVRDAGVDAFLTGTGKITVIAIIDQEKSGLSRSGFLRTSEIEAWTSASSGDKVIDLPVDYPYRAIFLRAYRQNSDPLGAISKLKLVFDEPKYTHLEMDSGEFMRMTHYELGLPAWITKWCRFKNGDTVEFPCMRNSQCVYANDGNATRHISVSNYWKGYMPLSLTDQNNAAVTSRETHEFSLLTWMYQNGLIIPFGRPYLEDNWFPTPSFKKSKLTISEGSASHAMSCVVQEVAA